MVEARIMQNPKSPSPTIFQFRFKVLSKRNPKSKELKKAVEDWISYHTTYKILKGDLTVNIAIYRSDVNNLKKVDVDNLAKTCLDALNKIVFDDDRQVKLLIISKHYSEKCKIYGLIEDYDEDKFNKLIQDYNYNLDPIEIRIYGNKKLVEV